MIKKIQAYFKDDLLAIDHVSLEAFTQKEHIH